MDFTVLTAGFDQVKHGPGGFLAEGTIWTKHWKRVDLARLDRLRIPTLALICKCKARTRRLPVFWRIFCYTGRKNQGGGLKTRVLVPEERSQESHCSLKGLGTKGWYWKRFTLFQGGPHTHGSKTTLPHGPAFVGASSPPLMWWENSHSEMLLRHVTACNQLTRTQSLGIQKRTRVWDSCPSSCSAFPGAPLKITN